jgi:hypothetical protein
LDDLGRFDTYRGVRIKLIMYQICIKNDIDKGGSICL